MTPIKPTQQWVHHRKGTKYLIIAVANTSGSDPEKFPPIVVYGDSLGRIWARPVKEFREKFTKVDSDT